MSVATLGLAVDSGPVVTSTKALKDLTAAAKPAAQAAADLSKAASGSAVSLKAGTAAATDHANAHKGLSTQAMAAQHSIRSMVEQLALGIPPTQILTGQLNHLSYAASGPGGLKGAFTEALSAFRSFLTPTTALVAGLAAISAVSAAAVISVAKLEKQFDDTSRAVGTTLTQLHGLDSAAAFKGIDTKDFLDAIGKFGAGVYDAQHGMGALAETFRANNTSAKSFNDYLARSADLIKNAASDQQRLQLLQQMGLPATMDWVRFMSQGSQGIKDAIAEAGHFNDAADQQLIAKARAFDEAWDRAVKNLKNGLRDATIQGASWLDQLSDAGTRALIDFNNAAHKALPGVFTPDQTGTNLLRNAFTNRAAGMDVGSKLTNGSSVDQFYSGLGKGAPGNSNSPAGSTIDPNVLQHQIQLEQQHIGLLGQTATAADAVRAVELQVQSARLSGVAITQKQVDVLKQLAYQQSIGVTAIKAQTDAYRLDAAVVGMSAGAAAQYAAVQNALNDAKRAGRSLSAADVAAITSEASALGDAAAKADLMRTAYTGLVQGPLQTLTSQIANGAKFFDALKSAGISALNAIANKLADMAAQSLWKAAFGGSSGGGLLGLLGIGGGSGGTGFVSGLHSGGIVGSESTFQRSVPTSTFAAAPRFHTGLMPDEFPAILQKGEGVFTKGQMAAMGGSKSSAPPVTITNYNDFRGADPGTEARMKAYVDQSSQRAVVQAVQAVAKTNANNPYYLKAAR